MANGSRGTSGSAKAGSARIRIMRLLRIASNSIPLSIARSIGRLEAVNFQLIPALRRRQHQPVADRRRPFTGAVELDQLIGGHAEHPADAADHRPGVEEQEPFAEE